MTKLKLFFVFLLSLGASYGGHYFQIPKIDAFFLDLSQIAFHSPNPGSEQIVTFRMKPDVSFNNQTKMDFETFKKIHESIRSGKPKLIIYFFTKDRLGQNEEEKRKIFELLGKDDITYLNQAIHGDENWHIKNDPIFKNFPRFFKATTTEDGSSGAKDKKSRRIVIKWDQNTPDELIGFLNSKISANIDPNSFIGTFDVYESTQAWMKQWRTEDFGNYEGSPEQIEKLSKLKLLQDKIVIYAKWDGYSGSDDSPSVFQLFDTTDLPLETAFMPNYTRAANMLTNYFHPEVIIKKAPKLTNQIFIFIVVLMISGLFLFAPVLIGVLSTFILPLVFLLVQFGIIGISSWFLDFSPPLIFYGLIQFIAAPTLLVRLIVLQNRTKLQQQTELERQRAQGRIIAKSAKADVGIRIASQVAHDIRSPIMAIKVATQVASGTIAPEVQKLLKDASDRLQNLANDLLQKYRGGFTKVEFTNAGFDLVEVCQNLVEQTKVLFPNIQFEAILECETLPLGFPKFQIERALTNLLNNSIEALKMNSVNNPKVTIQIGLDTIQNQATISVGDNGPGVAKEILPRLFQEKATFGKSDGNGLGLFQVKQAIESLSGTISYDASGAGALFKIQIPLENKFTVIKSKSKLIWVDDANEIFKILESTVSKNIELVEMKSPEQAIHYFETNKSDEVIFVSDLIFQNSDQTGFELMLFLKNRSFKKFLCTSLGDNAEVQKFALDNQIEVIEKSDLFQIKWDL